MIYRLLLSFCLIINLLKAMDSVDYVEDLTRVIGTTNFNGDVHFLDHWVNAGNLPKYLNQIKIQIPQIVTSNPSIKANDFISRYQVSTGLKLVEDQNKFTHSINHMFGLGEQGSVRLLLVANLSAMDYYSQNVANNGHSVSFFQGQILDADGTCLQGQTNRLLMALHNTATRTLKYMTSKEASLADYQDEDVKKRSEIRLKEFTVLHQGTNIETLSLLVKELYKEGIYVDKDCTELGLNFEKFLLEVALDDKKKNDQVANLTSQVESLSLQENNSNLQHENNMCAQRLKNFALEYKGIKFAVLHAEVEKLFNSGVCVNQDCEALGINFHDFLNKVAGDNQQELDAFLSKK